VDDVHEMSVKGLPWDKTADYILQLN